MINNYYYTRQGQSLLCIGWCSKFTLATDIDLRIFSLLAGSDESSLFYVAMVMITVGKILRNLGLVDEVN